MSRDLSLTQKRSMKAVAYDKYGSFDVLALRDIAKPAVKEGEVLVRVRTASPAIAPAGGDT
jgi:hypothetical protein